MINSLSILKLTGHLFFWVLFVFSLLFFKERHAFDAAHYLFEIISRESFFTAHGRLIGIVSQVLPLLGVYAGASLKSLMMLYSFGDVLYYYILFLIAAHVLKSNAATISVLLIVCLAVKFSFYCPVTELLQAMALLPLLHQALLRMQRFQFHLIPLLLILIVFSHPLLFILTAFVIASFIVQQKANLLSGQNLFLLAAFFIITATKFLLLDKYDYQKSFYPVVFNDYSNISNLIQTDYLFSFFKMYAKENFLVIVLWIFTVVFLFTNKRFISFTLALFAPLLFMVLIIVTHRFSAITNYSERMLLPFAAMVILSFGWCVQELKSSFAKQFTVVIIACIISFRLWIIYDAASPYTKRVAQIEGLIYQAWIQNSSKCIADERNLEYLPYALTGWSYPLESLLLSSINSKKSSVTVALKEEHYNRFAKQKLALNEIYKAQDSIINYSMLNPHYFSLPLTAYTFLNSSCSIDSANDTSITINLSSKVNFKTENDYCYFHATVINSGKIVCSDVDSGYLMQVDAISVNDSAYRDSRIIPFQTDIVKELKQDLVFKNYGMKGKWIVSVFVIDKNKKVITEPLYTEININ